jgi:hypothetical protein
MTTYLMIETKDPYEASEAMPSYEQAARLARAGHTVTVFLVQNAVFAVRQGAKNEALRRLAGAGVELLADEFSLQERGIGHRRVMPQVKPAPLDVVVDRLAAGSKVLWH